MDEELEKYLAGLNDKKLKQSDNRLIAAANPTNRKLMGAPHKGKPSHLKGKQQSDEHISKRLTTRADNGFVPDMSGILKTNQQRARAVQDSEGNVYPSLAESARVNNVAVGTAQYRIKKGYWSYVDTKE